MSRSEITLQEWLNTDVKQKLKFIMNEIDPNNIHGILAHNPNTPVEKINVIFKKVTGLIEAHGILQINDEQNKVCFHLGLTLIEYNKLRAKYRRFNNRKNESNISKKQYKISQQTISNIKRLKGDLGLPREEYVIENLINSYLNRKEIESTKVQINTKTIKFNILNQEINKLNIDIQNLNNTNEYLSKKIKELEKLLATSYLKSDHYKDILNMKKIETSSPKIDDEKLKNKIKEIQENLKEFI